MEFVFVESRFKFDVLYLKSGIPMMEYRLTTK